MSSRKPRPVRQATEIPPVRSRHAVPTTMARVKLAAAALIVLGCLSLMMRSTGLDGQVNSGGTDDIAHDDLQLARGVVLRGNIDVDDPFASTGGINRAVVGDTEQPEVKSETTAISTTDPPMAASSETTAPSEATDSPATTADPPTSSTPSSPNVRLRQECYDGHDIGLIKRAATPTHVFCDSNAANYSSSTPQTQVIVTDAPSGLRSVMFSGLVLDLTNATTSRPIKSFAQDGGDHDPRLTFNHRMIYCSCNEFESFVQNRRSKTSQPFNVWDPALAFRTKRDHNDASLVCSGSNTFRPVDMLANPVNVVEFSGRVVLMPRRDDHNPFFQVSNALNTWIMLRALKWDPEDVTIVHLDNGYPSPVNELHARLLSPAHKILNGTQIVGKKLVFSGEVLLPPFEAVGPMMQHLDDVEPCSDSKLYQAFRDESLRVMKATPSRTRDEIVVTFISRKVYSRRRVQRRWLNEDEVISQLQTNYTTLGGKRIVFQSFDFVGLPLQQQMQLMLDSDVVISMHGAGLVNVLWTRPGTLVIEIFPFQRKRWGFRNICQFVGCDWHEFRGGRDVRTGFEANANDKIIKYKEWRPFFDPLFRTHVAKIIAATPASDGELDSTVSQQDAESMKTDSPALSLPSNDIGESTL